MDISSFIPKVVAEKYSFKPDIPGPVFTTREKGKLLYDFDAPSLTIEKCEALIAAKFPYIERKGAPATTKAAAEK